MLGLAVLATALLPVPVDAQRATNERTGLQNEWQLLRQSDEEFVMNAVPAGVGATLRLRAGTATIDGACSHYETAYGGEGRAIIFTVVPDDIEWRPCDEISQAFDETVYRNLADVAALEPLDGASVLTLNDDIGDPLMTFTRAKIDEDPSAARWGIARLGAADGSIERIIAGVPAWMEFLPGGSLVGNTGCGSFLGHYTVNENALTITDVASRLTACTEQANAQAEQILGTLDEITGFMVRPAGLTLNDAAGTTRFALVPPGEGGTGALGSGSSGNGVGGQIWTPLEVRSADGATLREGNELSTTSVRFSGAKVEGRTICRWYEGQGIRSGLAITVDDIVFTSGACRNKPGNPPIEQIEADFITALEATSSYALRGSELELKDVDGNTRMRLRPQPPLVGPTWEASWIRVPGETVTGEAPTVRFEELGGVLQGLTGAGADNYIGFYNAGTASRLVIDPASIEVVGRACRTKKARATAACKQEAKFIRFLKAATGYTVREEDLRLLGGAKGTNTIMLLQRQVAGAEE
jgi:heat shock protein HslJ